MDHRPGAGVGGRPPTLTEATYERLRRDILLGLYAPDEKLKLEAMRDNYGVSVNTLRETLSRLTSEGLVVNRGQGGFAIVPASLADLRDIIAMRQMLECRAARLSLENADIEWEARLVAAYHKLSRAEELIAVAPLDHADLYETYNREFHAALISECRSRWLLTFHGVMYDQSQRYRMLAFRVRDFPREQSRREHREILDAALARDADRLDEVLTAHITKGAELYHEADLAEAKPARRGPKKGRAAARRA